MSAITRAEYQMMHRYEWRYRLNESMRNKARRLYRDRRAWDSREGARSVVGWYVVGAGDARVEAGL